MVKYGAQKLLSEYKASLRLKEKNNSKSKSKKSGYYSKVCNDNVYYCNYSNRVICDDNDIETVKYLINRQNKKGTVTDWLQGYRDEIKHIKDRRLITIEDDSVSDYIKKNSLPMRMILEYKRDGRHKGRLVAIGYLEPYHWDIKSNSSPVSDMSSVKILLYEAGNSNDIISSVDIS